MQNLTSVIIFFVAVIFTLVEFYLLYDLAKLQMRGKLLQFLKDINDETGKMMALSIEPNELKGKSEKEIIENFRLVNKVEGRLEVTGKLIDEIFKK